MPNNKTDIFSQLNFRYPFRRYQQQILDRIKLDDKSDSRFHLIAPPGSGKTVVGLELIKRLNKPAVVFAPNTTIQLQWRKEASLFLPPEKKFLLQELVSLDPGQLKPINIFTYQLISTPEQNNQFLVQAGLTAWQKDLIENRTVLTFKEALLRIKNLKRQNQRSYSLELRKYKKLAKKRYLEGFSAKVESVLHPNARKLIHNLVNHDVETIVLDEVHHLLDYWAIVINTLARKIPTVNLIGLTATPPRSASSREKENYLALMGEIDYEIPTPAVVKEGNLAPYQDLLYLCQPAEEEKNFINNIQLQFEDFITSLSADLVFKEFILKTLNQAIEEKKWRNFFKKDPLLAIALVKYLILAKMKIPRQVVLIREMKREINLDDWSELLKEFSLNFLKVSSKQEHQVTLDRIRATLRMFGFSLTEAGIRNYRSPTDLILALSKAKTRVVITILKTEIDSLDQKLRAVIITDFEKMSLSVRRKVKNILDPEAGGAVGVFKAIAKDPATTELEPILITGSGILVDDDELVTIVSQMKKWCRDRRLKINLTAKKTSHEGIKQIVGRGKDFKTSVYVRMVTDLFEAGVTRCLVGTRGLIGEGWNSLRVNTLLDLTSVTTSTSTNQIRGRALRKDPAWPEKLANIWYIACLDTSFEKGDQDLKRVIKKHRHFYGINHAGEIIKGLAHIDEGLMFSLKTRGFRNLVPKLINQRMLQRSRDRQAILKKWRIGLPFENIALSGLSLDRKQIKIKTAYTIKDTARGISLALAESVFGFSFWFIQNFYQVLKFPFFQIGGYGLEAIGLIMFLVAIQIHAGLKIKKFYHQVLTQIPVDSYVQDIALAVIFALKEAALISQNINQEELQTRKSGRGRIHVEVKNTDPNDSRVINHALSDIFSSVTDQRYLILRTLNRLPIGILSPLWWMSYNLLSLLQLSKPTYHPVPDILSVNRKRAKIFAKHWRKYVGGGKLVYTRSKKGNKALLYIRQRSKHHFDQMIYETWH
ncbi:DEAD/DEAH box helicase [Patescibacteria group bacterium]